MAVDAISRVYVVPASLPLWEILFADWNRTVAAWVIAPTLPSTGPAVQPSRFNRVCAALFWVMVSASAGIVIPATATTSVAAPTPSLVRTLIFAPY